MNIQLNWPESLSQVTLDNMNLTELWFVKQTCENDDTEFVHIGTEVRTPKFGYQECLLDIGDERYLIKYKSWLKSTSTGSLSHSYSDVVFHIQKFKKPQIGQKK